MANPKIDIDMDDIGSHDVSVDRMRRMKALANTLYRDEIGPKRRFFRPIRAKGLIMAASLLAIVILSASSLYNFNRFIDLKEKVFSAQGHVEANLQRRKNLFANLVNITLNQAAVERQIFSHVADVRAGLNKTNEILSEIAKNPDAVALLNKAKDVGNASPQSLPISSVTSSLSRLLAVVEQYPDIKSSTTYQQLMDKLVEIENRISARRSEYNDAARIYNHSVSVFPWYLLAKVTGFLRVDYFKASDDVIKVPVLSQKSFEQLLPDGGKR
ncbi:MAG: hypothetical protein IEMM0002_1354 [bacterium]|nr:MAG: hypothetical protein IEMM0002_1354 [bacterium]